MTNMNIKMTGSYQPIPTFIIPETAYFGSKTNAKLLLLRAYLSFKGPLLSNFSGRVSIDMN